MVALKSFVPLVRFQGGTTTAFEGGWLLTAIEKAVRLSGAHSWPLADEFVTGVTLYLKLCCLQTVIDAPDLERAVRQTLHEVGYGDVASHFGVS